MHKDPETIDVRSDESLDLTRLEPWLRANLPATDGPLDIRQFGGGHANLTYLLAFGDTQYVLRRPPLGPVAPSAHDMSREHRVPLTPGQGLPPRTDQPRSLSGRGHYRCRLSRARTASGIRHPDRASAHPVTRHRRCEAAGRDNRGYAGRAASGGYRRGRVVRAGPPSGLRAAPAVRLVENAGTRPRTMTSPTSTG